VDFINLGNQHPKADTLVPPLGSCVEPKRPHLRLITTYFPIDTDSFKVNKNIVVKEDVVIREDISVKGLMQIEIINI